MGVLEKISQMREEEKKEKKINVKISYEGKEIYSNDMELRDFAAEVLDSAEISLFYACKDFVDKIEGILAKEHQKMILDKMAENNKA